MTLSHKYGRSYRLVPNYLETITDCLRCYMCLIMQRNIFFVCATTLQRVNQTIIYICHISNEAYTLHKILWWQAQVCDNVFHVNSLYHTSSLIGHIVWDWSDSRYNRIPCQSFHNKAPHAMQQALLLLAPRGWLLVNSSSLEKMAAVLQTIFSNTFSWIKKNCILIKIPLIFVPKGPINNNPALV